MLLGNALSKSGYYKRKSKRLNIKKSDLQCFRKMSKFVLPPDVVSDFQNFLDDIYEKMKMTKK